MEIEELIPDVIQKLYQKHRVDAMFVGVVKEVQDNTCTVQQDNGAVLYKVGLCVVADALGSFVKVKPKVDSAVLCGIIGSEPGDACIIQSSEIDEVQILIGNKTYNINADGHLIKGGTDTLKQALDLIIEAIEYIIVLKGRNPDRVKLEAAKNKIQNILQ